MSCTVRIASPLHSYTAGASRVEGRGATLAEVLGDLEQRFPGIRFRMIDEQDRIRPHLRLFVNTEEARDLARKSIELNPNFPDCHFVLALVYEKLGDSGKAVDHRRIAEEVDPVIARKLRRMFENKSKRRASRQST